MTQEMTAVPAAETEEIPEAWRTLLPPQTAETADRLLRRSEEERTGHTVYPPRGSVFRALRLTPPEKVRAVIVGQDPYHTPGAACGLAFSVPPGAKIPPSLRNIFKELQADLGCGAPSSGDLTPWAMEGVLLINTILTVEQGKAASHSRWGWQAVVADILRVCAEQLPQPLVFLLWGGYARTFAAGMDLTGPGRACLVSSHPSPLGAGKGSSGVPAFLGSRPFSRTNRFLEEAGSSPVRWILP